MENSKILLGKVGEWSWSKFYFDKEANCFIEEKYHEEYLDTGTIFEGASSVLPQQIYAAFVEALNFNGVTALLECFDRQPSPKTPESEQAEMAFFQQLDSIDQTLKAHLQIINGTYILRNKYNAIIGILFSNDPFYAYKGLYRPCKGFVSKADAFAFAVECLHGHYTQRSNLINNRTSRFSRILANDPQEKGLTKYETLERILTIET